jgi:hypothetical protein
MTQPTRQPAWIHGLPGAAEQEGVPVEVLDFTRPQHTTRELRATVEATADVTAKLRDLAMTRRTVPRLSVVVRTDAKSELDDAYRLTDAQIVSVNPRGGMPRAVDVIILFNKIELVAGVKLNPGPPPDAPEVGGSGPHSGWIHRSAKAAAAEGIQVEVVDFTPPCFNGRLAVTFGAPSLEVQRLLQARKPLRELIFVLPDRARGRYVEFKLGEARATTLPGVHEQRVAFDSDVIECLTG